MTRPRLARGRWVTVAAVIAIAAAGAAIATAVTSSPAVGTRSVFVPGTPEADGTPARIDATVYLPETTPAPAVLLAHGFGGSKSDLDSEARSLAQHGYVVLAYTARGFGRSGGLIHLDAPT
ncbi:MAG: CocE/NonD family hydrolase, partial [Dermatophilaceae bacterium]